MNLSSLQTRPTPTTKKNGLMANAAFSSTGLLLALNNWFNNCRQHLKIVDWLCLEQTSSRKMCSMWLFVCDFMWLRVNWSLKRVIKTICLDFTVKTPMTMCFSSTKKESNKINSDAGWWMRFLWIDMEWFVEFYFLYWHEWLSSWIK